MKVYTVDEMKQIFSEHAKWVRAEGGSRANLAGADLAGANLTDANLTDANLSDANLGGANLSDANLMGANLRGANLTRSNLTRSNLTRSNLTDANLSDANLRGANLRGADLRGADLTRAKLPSFQICSGDLIVWKKIQGKLVTLLIPLDAKRTASLIGRKLRAEYAVVKWIEGDNPVMSNGCNNGVDIVYRAGETVTPDSYDDDIRVECSHGIHFFLTRQEAEEWNN